MRSNIPRIVQQIQIGAERISKLKAFHSSKGFLCRNSKKQVTWLVKGIGFKTTSSKSICDCRFIFIDGFIFLSLSFSLSCSLSFSFSWHDSHASQDWQPFAAFRSIRMVSQISQRTGNIESLLFPFRSGRQAFYCGHSNLLNSLVNGRRHWPQEKVAFTRKNLYFLVSKSKTCISYTVRQKPIYFLQKVVGF